MKIYYFLNNAGKNSYDNIVSKIELLKSGYTTFDLVNNFYNKVGVFNQSGTSDANFLESISFIEFLEQTQNLSYETILSQIEWIYDTNFSIYNEDIYIQRGNFFECIDTKTPTYFVTSRDSFGSPFFLVLYALSKKNKNIKIVKYNSRLDYWSYNDKSFYISSIYPYRKEYIGDILFPLFQNKESKNIHLFFEFAQQKLGSKIMLKKNFGDMGIGIKPMDIENIQSETIEFLKEKFIPEHHGSFQGVYVSPYIKIHKEFRVYYRYENENMLQVYSVKNRINKEDPLIFEKPNLKIYENIQVEWTYVENNEFLAEKKYLDFLRKICIKIQDNCGVLEFFEDSAGKLYFCEINSLGGSLMFPGIDQENMMNYYIDTLKMIF